MLLSPTFNIQGKVFPRKHYLEVLRAEAAHWTHPFSYSWSHLPVPCAISQEQGRALKARVACRAVAAMKEA